VFVLTCRMDHSVVLEKLCRVCGRSVVSKSVKTKYQCKIYLDGLKMVFGVDARQDNPLIHPQHFCHACKTVLHKATTRPFQHLTTPFEGWCHHVEGGCTVCTHYQAIYRGGRPKTKKRTPGRPPNISHQHCITHVRTIAPPPLQLTSNEGMEVCSIHQLVPLAQLECSLCHSIPCCPVELVTCGNVVCTNCLCTILQQQESLECPCCHIDHLRDFATIRSAPPIVLSMLESVCVVCHKCTRHMKVRDFIQHTKTSCEHEQQVVQEHSSVQDLLQQPLTAPLTAIEQKLQTSLARRSMNSSDNVLQMKTGGKVELLK